MPNPGVATSTSKQQRKTTNGNTGATKAETKRTVAPSSKRRFVLFGQMFLLKRFQYQHLEHMRHPSLEVVSGIPCEIYRVKGSSLLQKFSPSFKSTLQIEDTLQAWDWKLDGLDIGKLPKWRSFRALPIRFARQHRQNSPELTFTSWLGDERRWFRLGKKMKKVQVEETQQLRSLCLRKNESHHRVTKLQQERHLSLHLFDQRT